MFRIMKVILEEHCLSLVGTIERGLGYHIEHRKNGFFSKRDQRGHVPPDGHWRFIVLCADMAQNKLYITDIQVSREELEKALYEAHIFIAMQNLRKDIYDARDIINLKITFSL